MTVSWTTTYGPPMPLWMLPASWWKGIRTCDGQTAWTTITDTEEIP